MLMKLNVSIFLFAYLFIVLFKNRVPLHRPGYPGTHCIKQAGLEFEEICLYVASQGTKDVGHHAKIVAYAF